MLVKFSVKKPFTVFVGVVLVIILGIVAFTNMTPDLLPSLDLPYAVVATTYPGATPEQIETIITKPIEQAMATLDNIKSVSSTSSENASVVVLEFSDEADMGSSVVDMREKLDMISGYWDDSVGTPIILKINPNMLATAVVAVDMEGLSGAELTDFVNDNLLSSLEGVDGVASVSTSGMIEESVRIVLSQEKIDKINADIRSAVLKEFEDGEADLSDAKNEIDDGLSKAESGQADIDKGKKELEDAETELTEKLGDAKSQLNAKQVELIEGKLAIINAQKELETQLEELGKTEKQLRELKATTEQLEEAEAALNSGIASLESAKDNYDKLTAARTAAIAQARLSPMFPPSMSDDEVSAALYASSPDFAALEDGLDLIESSLAAQNLTPGSLPDAINGAKTQLASVESGLAQIDSTLKGLGMKRRDISKSLSEILDGESQLRDGIGKIERSLEELESGQLSLNDAFAELEAQGITAVLELSSSKSQITTGEAMIESTLNQLDSAKSQIVDAEKKLLDTKEDALAAADISDKITLSSLSGILAAQNFSMPAGYVSENGADVLVRVGDKFDTVDDFGELLLFDTGLDEVGVIRLSDVADVSLSDNSEDIYAKVNDNSGVLLSFSKQSTSATADVSNNLSDEFMVLSERYPGLTFTVLMDQGDYIRIVVDSVLNNLILGAALAVLILILFLRDLKPTFIIACSIPISVTFALVLMYFSGVTLNIISLAGLATGVGMLVDNSIVVIENIYRLRGEGVSPVKAAVSGTVQVAGAITSSTLTTICVFFPIVFVQGLTRQLFTDMALTIGYSLLASLVVALTLIPAMAPSVLKNIKSESASVPGPAFNLYERSVTWSLEHRALALAAAAALLIASGALALAKGFTYMPDMESPQIMVSLKMPEGSLLKDSSKTADEASSLIRSIDGVSTVGSMLSDGMMSFVGISGEGGGDVSSVSMYVIMDESGDMDSARITREITDSLSVLNCEVSVSGGAQASGMSMLTGSGLAINLFGDDLSDLQDSASKVASVLKKIDGTETVSDGIDSTSSELHISVDKEKAMQKGLTVAQIYSEFASATTREKTATTVTSGGRNYDIVIVSEKAEQMSPDDVEDYLFTVTGADGKKESVRLGDIATISKGETLSSISRSANRRFLTVSAAVAEGYNVSLVTSAAEEALADIELPDGVSMEFSGENTAIIDAMTELLKMLALGVLFVYLIMVAQFQSLRSPFIVMFTIPLAFTGGLLALLICNMEISVIAMIGFVMLVGIIVNNGIVLVDYINQLRLDGVDKRTAILEAGKTRLRPIMMTALTTVLGLLPIAFGAGMGSSLIQPVAVTCIGGLIYATLMTLIIVPVMYDLMGPKSMRVVTQEELEVISV